MLADRLKRMGVRVTDLDDGATVPSEPHKRSTTAAELERCRGQGCLGIGVSLQNFPNDLLKIHFHFVGWGTIGESVTPTRGRYAMPLFLP